MRRIVECLLEEGIDESMIHRVLDLIEEEYEVVDEGRLVNDDRTINPEGVKELISNVARKTGVRTRGEAANRKAPGLEQNYNDTFSAYIKADQAAQPAQDRKYQLSQEQKKQENTVNQLQNQLNKETKSLNRIKSALRYNQSKLAPLAAKSKQAMDNYLAAENKRNENDTERSAVADIQDKLQGVAKRYLKK